MPEAEISYTLGQPSFSFGTYQFVQNPDCGYPQTVSIENEPPQPFFTHNTA